MTVFLTLPAFNEAEALPLLLGAFCAEMEKCGATGRVVIVDDGSVDETVRVIRQWSGRVPIELVRHEKKLGLGETIRDGLRRAAELAAPDDAIVTMDADNTHSPSQIPRMLALIAEGHDVVIASRYRPGSRVVGLGPFRVLMSHGARVLFQLCLPIPGVRDYTCGFRAYRASVIQKANDVCGDSLVTERSFACMAEILVKLARMRPAFVEVPMVLRYDRKKGVSGMNVPRTTLGTLSLIARLRFATAASRPQGGPAGPRAG